MKSLPKLYVGPMSKNVVDAVLEYSSEQGVEIGFIPSRRQVEFTGGYVNNWTTEQFSKYVNRRVPIERDHGGPGQGLYDDDGSESFRNDSKYFDILHIDPWKKYKDITLGAKVTVEIIKTLHNLNSKTLFEIGTEESIRKFSEKELEKFLMHIENSLDKKVYKKIVYCVIQSGVGLDLAKMTNTGTYAEQRLVNMINIANKFGLLTKEHNGDYLTEAQILQRFKLGLSAINIAPEFGQIETKCYYENMSSLDKELFYTICRDSKRWEKWVKPGFSPENSKEDVVTISGHYNFSNPKFEDIKPDIDSIVKQRIKDRLKEVLVET